MRYFLILISFLFFLSACSTNENDPLEPQDSDAETYVLTVSAADTYYFNFTQQTTVNISDPLFESNWDMAINVLTNFRLNGGATAPGDVYAVKVEGTSFADLTTAPDVQYNTDTQDEDVIGENWYFYDINTHTVNPLDHFYVIKSVDGNYYKFRVKETVFSSQSDGELTLEFAQIDPPSNPDFVSAEGRVQHFLLPLSGSEITYFNFENGSVVSVSDSLNSMDWDLNTNFVTITLNGGVSGPGQAAAVEFQDTSFEDIVTVPASGFVEDSADSAAIGGNWYNYDFMTHKLTPHPYVYVVRTAAGDYAKFQIIKTDFSGMGAGHGVLKYEFITAGNDF